MSQGEALTKPALRAELKPSIMHLNEIITKNDLEKFKVELLAEIQKMISKPELPESFLKSKDVKRLLGCNDSTLQYYRDSGKIAFRKIGGRYYYSQEDFKALFQ